MARQGATARQPSPIFSATDSLPTVSASHRSSSGSKESPSTRPTSVSSNLSDPMEKPLYPIFTKAAAATQGLKRKLPQAIVPSVAPVSTQDEARPAKKTRRSLGNTTNKASTELPTSKPLASAQPKSHFFSTVLRDDEPVSEPPKTRDSSSEIIVVTEENEISPVSNDEPPEESAPPAPEEVSTPRKKRKSTKAVRKSPRVAKMKTSVLAKASALGKRGKGNLKRVRTLRSRLAKDPPKTVEPQQQQQSSPAKAKKISVVPVAASPVKASSEAIVTPKKSQPKKRYLDHGLYVGQKRNFDPNKSSTKTKSKMTLVEKKINAKGKENKLLPLPMFSGEQLLDRGRDFKLPFDVFNPLPRGQPKPDEWWKKQANRFIGDAALEWKKTKPLPTSTCLCTPEDGCNEDCHNRYMLYECDEGNCAIGPEYCTNRAFTDLKVRRESGKKYDIGVEVLKTAAKGFGVRACRTFQPNQVIVEYTGEIITQEECERRMREEYKDNECYYLMTFDQNMIIDATRGSIARFVNHSCAPNCRMTKWVVAGKPRMALFAGDKGIMTGEELTYDYNFDPFSQKNVQVCRCGAPLCRGVLGPRPSKEREAELKKLAEKAKNAVVAGTKRGIEGVLGSGSDKAQPKAKKQKPKGSGVWGGKWEWVKVKA